jgi:hypothetical protein
MKFVGFSLKNDRTTLAGLPPPIHEGVDILKSHLYKSLAELQIEVRGHSLGYICVVHAGCFGRKWQKKAAARMS